MPTERNKRQFFDQTICFLLFVILSCTVTVAGVNDNTCDPGEEPDVIVGDIPDKTRWGSTGGITAFSYGTTSCNIGTCGLNWVSNTNEHPVIGQNMYRLKNGRFEQIGQSWLKHGFFALSQELCDTGCIPTSGSVLGVNCSDPYSSGLNGSQGGLGPKDQVNAANGIFPYPFRDSGVTGNSIYKRLQVENSDLDPAQNSGAQYWVEAQYITADDAAANNDNNNASYRKISVSGSGGNFDTSFVGSTVRARNAIRAWPGALLKSVAADGRFTIGSKATDIGGGQWAYEYAVYNMNSNRSGGGFRVPVTSATITNIGFHDVDYHSGEQFDGTDWPGVLDSGEVVWRTTQTFGQNSNANAIRWGTLYNFRFVANLPPAQALVTLEMFRPGSPSQLQVLAWVPEPQACNGNGQCDPGEDPCDCPVECSAPPTETSCTNGVDDDCDGFTDCEDFDCDDIDADGDGYGQCTDCNDSNDAINPGELDLCDGINNDCNGGTPDGADEPWAGQACDGADADECAEGVFVCQNQNQVCNDTTGNARECPDGFDNDCDGSIDEGSFCGDGFVGPGEECDDANQQVGDGCRPDCTAEHAEPNFLINGDFETGELSPWRFFDNADGSARVVNGTAEIDLPTVGSSVQLLQRNLSIVGGETYRVSFDAGCQNNGDECDPGGSDIAIAVIQDVPPYALYGLNTSLALDTCRSTYVFEFTPPAGIGSVNDARVRFWFSSHAEDGNSYLIDNVYFEPLCATAGPELCDGLDNDCNAATADGSDEPWMGDACDGADSDQCLEGVFECVSGFQTCADTTDDDLERCDGIDNDCNLLTIDGVDEAWLGAACDGADSDQCLEGVFECNGGLQVCLDATDDNVETCDGLDNDCNGAADEDLDADGFDACADCDNADPATFPGAPETNDGIDNQCAGDAGYGQTDEITGLASFWTSDTLYSWPEQSGATGYEVVRSLDPTFPAGCWSMTTSGTQLLDPEEPAPFTIQHYLMRATSPNPGDWGLGQNGAGRENVCQ